MDGDEIELVLARAIDIRSKIDDCIAMENGDVEETTQSLIGVKDALESLERQLVALQTLEQQQRYERESFLAQIDRNRMVLLSKLRDYKGEDFEVLHDAAAFAGEKIEHDDGLFLPPYPIHLPDLFAWNDFCPSSHLTTNYKLSQNGPIANLKHENSKEHNNKSSSKGLRGILGFLTRSMITVVGVISILSLAGYQPMIKKWPIPVKTIRLFGTRASHPRKLCPSGKVLVVEDGKARCLVKERVEIPFESYINSADIMSGFG